MPGIRKVGKVKDAHGLRGELAVLIFSKDTSWLKKLKTFSLNLKDEVDPKNPQSFEVEKAKPFKDGLIVKPASVADRTQAEKLKGQFFYIPEELLTSEEGEGIYLSEIEGFEIQDPQGKTLGKIVGFTSNLAQDLLVVDKADGAGQAEIPFVDEFIEEIDFEDRVVIMDLPEGIWDLAAL